MKPRRAWWFQALGWLLWSCGGPAVLAQSGPPDIISQPQDQSVLSGGRAVFSVTASGAEPLSYQWRLRQNRLAGATNSTLTVNNVTLLKGGAYDVVVTNAFGAVTSSVALLSVDEHLTFHLLALRTNGFIALEVNTITGDDRGGMAASSNRVFLTGDTATGRWGLEFLNNGVRVGTIYDALVSDLRTEKVYSLMGTNGPLVSSGGSVVALQEIDGNTGLLTGNRIELSTPIPNLGVMGFFSGYGRIVLYNWIHVYDIALPSGDVLDLGSIPNPSAQYSESWGYWGLAEYFGNALYLVYAQSAPQVRTIVRTRVPDGETSTVAEFENLSDLASFTFSVSLSRWFFHYENSGQFFNGDEVLGSAKALYTTDPGYPFFVRPPQSQTNYPGSNVVFTVLAGGAAPLSYQWRFNGVDIAGATEATLVVANVDTDDGGAYTVVVGNPIGEVESPPAVLTVQLLPEILGGPFNDSAYPGETATFWVVATGPPPLEFQWSRGGVDIRGATNSTLVITNVQPDDAGTYQVQVRNPYASIDSSPAQLTVISAPLIYQQPQDTAVVAGTNATFQVFPDGAPPLFYQWRFNEEIIPGATNQYLVLSNVAATNAGFYSVVISNAYGSALSSNAQLTVITIRDDGSVFRITGLLTNGSRIVDHNALTGDDRGGIAASSTQLFCTGDDSTARFALTDLSGGFRLNRLLDSMVSNLRTERVYLLGNGPNVIGYGGGTVTTLLEIDGVTANPTGTRIQLSQPVLATNDVGEQVGLFSGYDRVVIHNGQSVFNIDLPSGRVTPFGNLPFLHYNRSESWAYWGVAEHRGGYIYLVYASWDRRTMARTRLPDGLTETAASFFDLGEMASFTVSIPRQRWYFHYEFTAQFGTTANGETVGYAPATFEVNSGPNAATFQWSAIGSQQAVNGPFPVTLTARTTSGEVATNFQGVVTLRGIPVVGGQTVPLSPAVISNFSGGVWTGQITVLQTSTNMYLRADDGAGTVGNSSSFAVNPPNDLILLAAAEPNPVVVGTPLTYLWLVTNTGPANATGVVWSNQLPTNLVFTSMTASQGACSNDAGFLRCDFGTVAGAAWVEVIVVPSTLGSVTNRALITRGEPDASLANNIAVVITTVSLPRLSINDVSIVEGDSGTNNAVFTVTLTPASTNTVSVNFGTGNGSATLGGNFPDYVVSQGVLVFPPGVTTQLLPVGVRGDAAYETNEAFYVFLSNATNGTIARPQGACTILNDDPVPTVTIDDVTVTEGNTGTTFANFPLQLSAPCGYTVIVPYFTSNWTAIAGSDFLGRTGNVSWPAGTLNLTQFIQVRINGDTVPESNETYLVILPGATNAALARSAATGTILNDDGLGEAYRFEWAPIASPQPVGQSFPVTVTARDVMGGLATNFTGTVALDAWPNGPPLATNFFGSLTFSNIGSGDYTVGFAFRPNTNLVVTHLRHYAGSKATLWTDDGVVLTSQPITSTPGEWFDAPLDVPVNLVAGERYRLAYYTGGQGLFLREVIETNLPWATVESGYYNFGDAFPTEDTAPGWAVDLGFFAGTPSSPLGIAPTNSGAFVAGQWSGTVVLAAAATNVVLRADDGAGHAGESRPFDVADADSADLQAALVVAPAAVTVGSNITLTLAAFNAGPAAAPAVQLLSLLPEDWLVLSAESAQGTVRINDDLVSIEAPLLPSGGIIIGTIVARANAPGTNTVFTAVASAGTDPQPTNDLARVTVSAMLDSDGDGMWDVWEDANQLDRNFAGDAAQDSDGDGHSNLLEFQAGTDPRDPNSVTRIRRIVPEGASLALDFQGAPGRRYYVETATALSGAPWQPAQEFTLDGGVEIRLHLAASPGRTHLFYRVRLAD